MSSNTLTKVLIQNIIRWARVFDDIFSEICHEGTTEKAMQHDVWANN
jgi:hypothetical protein